MAERREPTLAVDLSQAEPIPEAGIERAVALMRSGRLHRYGEDREGEQEVSALEREWAELVGRRYAVAFNSCGTALFAALRCVGVEPADRVLLNAFTLAPVPGAIAHAGAAAALVEITEDLVIDVEDLDRRAAAGDARVLLLSHMRGHVADMDAVAEVCRRRGLVLVEDCAHTLGATWGGRASGSFGTVACFSAQTYKHVNAGEGGMLVTDDDEVAARAILLSGSYALYGQHAARPGLEVLERLRGVVPNLSLRMSSLAAAVLRPQLPLLPARIRAWNERYAAVADALEGSPQVRLPRRDPREGYVGSSIQFRWVGLSHEQMEHAIGLCDARGVHVKWYGAAEPVGFTSTFEHWGYGPDGAHLPRTRAVLESLCDLRIPLALTLEDCRTVGEIVRAAAREAHSGAPAPSAPAATR